MAMVEICLGDVVASVVRVTTGRNRHHLDQWNDSFCLISQPQPNGLVEITYKQYCMLGRGELQNWRSRFSWAVFRLDLESEFGKGVSASGFINYY